MTSHLDPRDASVIDTFTAADVSAAMAQTWQGMSQDGTHFTLTKSGHDHTKILGLVVLEPTGRIGSGIVQPVPVTAVA